MTDITLTLPLRKALVAALREELRDNGYKVSFGNGSIVGFWLKDPNAYTDPEAVIEMQKEYHSRAIREIVTLAEMVPARWENHVAPKLAALFKMLSSIPEFDAAVDDYKGQGAYIDLTEGLYHLLNCIEDMGIKLKMA